MFLSFYHSVSVFNFQFKWIVIFLLLFIVFTTNESGMLAHLAPHSLLKIPICFMFLQVIMAPTALTCARWTPVNTSRRAPGSRAPLAVTPVTVPTTTSAITARKSTAFHIYIKHRRVGFNSAKSSGLGLNPTLCCLSLPAFLFPLRCTDFPNDNNNKKHFLLHYRQDNWPVMSVPTGPTCRVPEAGGVTRPAAPATVRQTRVLILIATRQAESVAARWASIPDSFICNKAHIMSTQINTRCAFFLTTFTQSQPLVWYRSVHSCRVLVTVCFNTIIPNLDKSFTCVLAVVPCSLDSSLTSFLSRVFEVFPFLPLPDSLCTL